MHLPDRAASGFRVIRSFGIETRLFWVPELEIRHVDVHHAIHEGEGVERVVCARVVNEGEMQASRRRQQQGLKNLWDDMFGSDQIDVVTALRLESQHHFSQFFGLDSPAFALPTNFVVLAEDATQVTPAKEDCARAPLSAEAAFLAVVCKIAADDGVAPRFACFGLVLDSVHVAVAWAESAVGQLLQTKLNA